MGAMRVSYRETSQIAYSMAELLQAGIQSDRLFAVLLRYRSRRSRKALETVRETVREGLPFHEGFRRSAWAWPPYFIELIRCAEMAGQLQAGFHEGAEHFRQMAQVKRAVFKLWFNPLMIVVAFWVATAALLGVFRGAGDAEMYLFGKVKSCLPPVLVLLGFIHLPPLRHLLDQAVIHIPFIGEIVRDLSLYKFTTCFNYLYIGAVSAPEIVRSAARAIGNSEISRRITGAAARVEKGSPFAEALRPAYWWPSGYIESIAVAEEAGQLQDTLQRLAHQRKELLESRVDKVRRVLEPLVFYVSVTAFAFAVAGVYLTRFLELS